MLRDSKGLNIVLCRSFEASSNCHAKIHLIRQVISRLIELEAEVVVCKDDKTNWKNIIQGYRKAHWSFQTALDDVLKMIANGMRITFTIESHLLVKEVNKTGAAKSKEILC